MLIFLDNRQTLLKAIIYSSYIHHKEHVLQMPVVYLNQLTVLRDGDNCCCFSLRTLSLG